MNPIQAKRVYGFSRIKLPLLCIVALILVGVTLTFFPLSASPVTLVYLVVIDLPLGTLLGLYLIWSIVLNIIDVYCPNCDKEILCFTRWRCGHCGNINGTKKNGAIVFPFLYRCSRCRHEPQAYICHHCQHPVFLNEKDDPTEPATMAFPTEPLTTEPDPVQERRKKHMDEKEELQQKIEIAALKKNLTQLEASPEFKRELSEYEKLEKQYSNYDAKIFGVQMLERSKRMEYAKMFRNDPDVLEMKNLAMDAFVEEFGLTPKRYVADQEKGTTTV